ncbi:MAG TPA: transporter substrate-binding domain-containing protein [Sphaerochaetaceae bacterium]|nr:transporter substrate-binding domain-containing protein [Sphaerochaetaceae bacterium]
MFSSHSVIVSEKLADSGGRSMRRWLLILFLCCSSIAFGADTLLQFSMEEQAFIERHPVIRMGIDPSFVPFEFLDSEGRHQGVSSDIVEYIERATGLQFLLMEGLSWQEVTNKAQRRELDVLPAVGRTQDRERYLLFSQPYVTFQRSIVVKNTNEGIRRFEDLFGRQVAVQANSSHQGLLEEYPQILVRTYDTVLDALLAVNRGDEIAFIGNDATTSYLASANGMTGLSFISQRNEGSGTITIGPLPRECRKRMERDPAPGAAAEAKPLGSASCPGVTISKRSESSGTTKWSLCRTSAGNESLLAYHSFLASFPVTCEYVTYSEKWYKGKRVNVLLVRITHQDFGAVAAHRFA